MMCRQRMDGVLLRPARKGGPGSVAQRGSGPVAGPPNFLCLDEHSRPKSVAVTLPQNG